MTYQAGAPPPCLDQSVEIVQPSLDVIPASPEVFDISDTNAEAGGESFRAPVAPAEGRRTTRARSKLDSPVGSPTKDKRNQGVSQEPQAGSSKRKLRTSDEVVTEPDKSSSQNPKKRKLKVEPSSELDDGLASKTNKVSRSSRIDDSVMEYDS
jgi:hypothetical protein